MEILEAKMSTLTEEFKMLEERNKALEKRIEALEQLLVCYRLGKRPSEMLSKKLEKTKEALIEE